MDTRPGVVDVGHTLGRYALLKRLAVGGMGEVFLAAKPGPVGFGPYVALKVLREELASDPQFVDMLVDEANISMFLNHQNVVSVLDLSEHGGAYYIAMEYVRGITVENLLEHLKKQRQLLEIQDALFVSIELCRALKYAHTRVNHAGEPLNIVHRDVTPANILLSVQGEVKLTDFGIARARGRVHQTMDGVLKGKFGYMAPEMVRYETIDSRADVFCAGVVTYQLLTGRHPCEGASIIEAMERFENKRYEVPSKKNPNVPPALDAVIGRALEPRPTERWPSAAALLDALQDVLLSNGEWRRTVRDSGRRLAERIREIDPEAFEEPVPRAELDQLLARAREQIEAPDPTTSVSLVSAPGSISFGPASEEPEIETDESLARSSVRAARGSPSFSWIGDTASDPLPPGARARGSSIPPGTTEESPFALDFPDSSILGYGTRERMLEEPSLPSIAAMVTATGPPGSTGSDQTVAAHPAGAGGEDRATMIGQKPAPDERTASGRITMREMDAPVPFDELPRTSAETGASVWEQEPLLQSSYPGLSALRGSSGRATWPEEPPGASEEDFGEATVMEGLEDDPTSELEVASPEGGVSAARPGNGVGPADEESGFDSTLMNLDQIVADSIREGPPPGSDGLAAKPPLVEGPIRIVMGPDGAPSLADPLEQDFDTAPPSSAPTAPPVSYGPTAPPSYGPTAPPSRDRGKGDAVSRPAPSSPAGERVAPPRIGADTGRWMAGEIGADALEWSDDAAARRAIATRNQGRDSQDAPIDASGAAAKVTRARAAPAGQRWLLSGALALAVTFFGALGYTWAFTRVFWPSLRIDSRPEGALVIVNGTELPGLTPLEIKIKPGSAHVIELRKNGFEPEVREVTSDVRRLRTYALPVDLRPVQTLRGASRP